MAYRVDPDLDGDEPVFPDGGLVAEVYETELEALFEEREESVGGGYDYRG